MHFLKWFLLFYVQIAEDCGAEWPLFPDDSESVAIIRHDISVINQAMIMQLNPDQVPWSPLTSHSMELACKLW